MRVKSSWFVLAALLLSGTQALAQGNVSAGKTVFENQCASCHPTEPGKQGFGPSLAAVMGRLSGTLPGYNFTPAMVNAHLIWDPKTLDEFLASSTQKVPGTSMPVSLPNESARADVIAYLGTLGHAAAFAPTPATPAVIAPVGHGPSQDELLRAASDTSSWLNASKDYAGQRFVDLNQINAGNAAGLRAVCIYRANSANPTQTNPLVYNGVMYLTVDQSIVAIDAATCRERWTYNWRVKDQVLSPVNRGAALKDGRVIRGTADGYLIAVDREKGTLLWSRKIADAGKSQYLSMPPLIVGDLIIYGPAGADWGAKNWIAAFKLENGDEVWRFNLIPNANEPGAESWTNAEARDHGGGSVWTPLSFDAENNVVFVPVGNPAPDFYREVRPGTNLYTDSVVALDIKTGTLLWYKQFVASDMHDWDLSQVSPIFRASVNGKQRNLMTVSGKDGMPTLSRA
jgi:alcohol dehydrogenase (cytochrome c)